MDQTSDAPAPPWGPGFLRFTHALYRVEYTVGFVAIFAVLFGWQWYSGRSISWPLLGQSLFWFLWPDLVAFVPIGLAQRGGRPWPRWGPALYDSVHTFLSWAGVFVIWSVVAGAIAWPLLGWAAHIAMDRGAGYYLRAGLPAT
ncbi:MAG TPA: hypothetical protein VFG07_03630 [Thermoplasmata archaeon]|nr:hypothetical protein [Thermoplasmata archaeon]